MMALTPEQQALKSKITTGAIIWGVVAGLVVALLAFWLLGGAGDLMRWIGTIILGGGAGYGAYRWGYNSRVAKAVCQKCGTAFGIREVDRRETVIGSEQRQKIEAARAPSANDPGANKVTTWTEEKVEVVAVDECFKCHDRTERKWTTTRERDKVENEVAIVPAAGAGLMGGGLTGGGVRPASPPPGPGPGPAAGPPPAPPRRP